MRLGIISTMAGASWGGSEELWAELAKKIVGKEHQVSVSVYDWKTVPHKILDLKKSGIKVSLRSRISYPSIKGKIKGKLAQLLLAERELKQFVKNEKPDILLVSMGAFCDLEIDSLRNVLLDISIPFYLVIHVNTETYVAEHSKVKEMKKACVLAKKIFFVSNRLKEQAERQIGYSFPNAEIVINPVNIKNPSIVPYTETPTLNMACVGRIQVDVKGQSILLQILGGETWNKRQWVLNIYGEGSDEELLKELIDFYGLKDRVFIKGYVKDIKNEIWSVNHILLMPSYLEGLPIVLMEAFLCGRTAVVTDVGGNREIIKDGVSGFIAEAATPFSFGKALEIAWERKTDWGKMGQSAYNIAMDYYGEDPVLRLWEKIKK